MKKKLHLTPQRLMELSQPEVRYIIQCPDENCLEHGTCTAGFFSHYLRTLYGIRLATRYNLAYYVDYSTIPHALCDPVAFPDNNNFWNYFFDQADAPNDFEKHQSSSSYETLPLRIWNRQFLLEMHQIGRKHLILRPEIEKIVTHRKPEFEKQRVLGVHIRRTDHILEAKLIPLAVFKQTIWKQLEDYDKVLIATDDQDALDEMLQEFGERILFNDAIRSRGSQPVHYSCTSNRPFQVGLDALIDAYCLSFCRKLILVHSNLSYTSLLLNPTVPYILLEPRKQRLKRWKTLGAYYLDRLTTRLPAP